MGSKLRGYLLAVLSSISYGLIPLFMLPLKAVGFPVDTTLVYRFSFAALFIGIYLVIKQESFKVSFRELLTLMALGCLFAMSSEFLFIGYDYATPGIASTILFVFPVFVALIMVFFFKEKISKGTVWSLFITVCGIFALSTKEAFLDINPLGVLFSLLSALSYALYIVVVNKAKIAASGTRITFYSLSFSAVFYLLKSLIIGETLAVHDSKIILKIVVFALVTTVVSVTSLVYAIQLIGSTPTAILGALEPIVAVCISVILFGEKLTAGLFAGIFLILLGVIINIISDSRKKVPEGSEERCCAR